MDIDKRTKGYKAHKIVSTALCAVASVAIIVFFVPLLIDVLTQTPDPNASVDLSGLGNAIYIVLAAIGAGIALALYIPSTVLGIIGWKGTLKQYKGKEKRGDKIWFGILTILPIAMEILLLSSILLVI
ncbi:MAG: hypothetical protein IJ039_08870 [Clostridia bacterium]|nr:hypothetical protein [Clostridia bacterium]